MEGQHAESAEISAGWETRKQGWMVLRPAWKSFPICPLGLCSQSPFLLSMCYDCIYRCATSGMKRRTGSTRKNTGSHSKWRLWPLKTNAALCVQTVWTKPESNDGTRLGGSIEPGCLSSTIRRSRLQGGNRWRRNHPHYLGAKRSEERRVGKECRSRWSPY